MGANDFRGGAIFDHRDINGRIYVEHHVGGGGGGAGLFFLEPFIFFA